MNEEVLQRLYESASVHFDMPDYEQFKADMENEETALTFRNSMSEHYDIPDEETFLSDIRGGEVKKKDDTDSESQEDSLDGQETEEETTDESFDVKDYGSIVGDVMKSVFPVASLGAEALEAIGVDVDNAVETGLAQGYSTKEVGAMILNDKVETLEDARKLVEGIEEYEKVGPSKNMIEYQKAAQKYEKEGNSEFSSAILALGDSPQVVPEVILTSLVATIPAVINNPVDMLVATGTGVVAGAAGGLYSGGLQGAAAGAIGGGAFGFRFGQAHVLDSALSSMEFMKEELDGKEMTPENVLEVLQDKEKYDRIVSRSTARGTTIGLVEGLLGKFASGLAATGKVSGIAGAVGTELLAGGLGEGAAQVVADQELSAQDIVLESVGGLLGAPGTMIEGMASRKIRSRYSINGEEVTKEKAEMVVDNLSKEELKDVNIGVENDDAFVQKVKDKRDAKTDEVQVSQKTDEKGRTFTYYSSTTERDGVKTTKFTFNRSDKSKSQRNQSFVEPEVAFGDKYEVDPESIPEGATIVGVTEIREGESGAAATVRFQNNDGSGTFLEGVQLSKKGDVAQQETTEQTKILVAPFYDTTIDSREDAATIREFDEYKQGIEVIKNTAKAFEVEIESIEEAIGGFENEEGNKIREVANVVVIKEGTPLDRVAELAAVLGANTTETQESTIAAQRVDENSEGFLGDSGVIENVISTDPSKTQDVLDALRSAEIFDFTYNETTGDLTILDFGKGNDVDFNNKIDAFEDTLINKDIAYGTREKFAVESRYIDPTTRKNTLTALEGNAIQQGRQGTDAYIAIQEAIKRSNEYLAQREEAKASKERVNREVENIVKKTKARKGQSVNPKKVLDNVLSYIQENTKLYEQMNDSEREALVIGLTKELGVDVERSPQVRTLLGIKKPAKETITVDPYKELKSRLRELEKVSNEAIKSEKKKGQTRLDVLNEKVKEITAGTKLSAAQVRLISKRVGQAVLDGRNMDAAMAYVDKVISREEMKGKINDYIKLQKALKKKARRKYGVSEDIFGQLDALAKLDISELNIDKIDDALDVLKVAAARGKAVNIPNVKAVLPKLEGVVDLDAIDVSQSTEAFAKRRNKDFKAIFETITEEEIAALPKDLAGIYETEQINVEDGRMTPNAIKIIESVEKSRGAAVLKSKTLNTGRMDVVSVQNKLKSFAKQLMGKDSSTTLERIRSNSPRYFDDVLGNIKGDEIYQNTIGRMSKAYSKMQADVDKLNNRLKVAEGLLKGTDNQKLASSQKMKLYELQLEYESNPELQGKGTVHKALDILDATIEKAKNRLSNDAEVRNLEKLRSDFMEGQELTAEQLYNKLSSNEKKAYAALKEAQSEAKIKEKMLYTGATFRGDRPTVINNYTHHQVISETANDIANLVDSSFKEMTGQVERPSTKSGTIEERTAGAKPQQLDIFVTSRSAAKQTLTDYHLTSPLRVAYGAIKSFRNDTTLEGKQREAAIALDRAFEESVKIVLGNDYVESNTFMSAAATTGYRAALASVPRALAELATNSYHSLIVSPNQTMRGMQDMTENKFDRALFRDVFGNLGSVHTARFYSDVTQSSAFAGKTAFTDLKGNRRSTYKSEVRDKMEQISSLAGKGTAAVGKIADITIESGDKIMSRPLWVGTFSESFEKATGSKPDYQKIASNDEQYMINNREALAKATFDADDRVAKSVTSLNPFDTIIKNAPKATDSNFMKIYKYGNSFMSRFTINEYGQARQAVYNLFQEGKMSKRNAAAVLAGITGRMAGYMVAYTYLRNLMKDNLGFGDEDEEVDYTELTTRQLVGSALTLMLRGTAGNIPMIPINMLVEKINESEFDALRGGDEYDPYKHSIVFSQVSPEDIERKGPTRTILDVFSGSYQYYTKAIESAATSAKYAITAEKEETRQKYRDKLKEVHLVDALGLINVLPFYKDIRTLMMAGFFKKHPPKEKVKARQEKDYEEYMRNQKIIP